MRMQAEDTVASKRISMKAICVMVLLGLGFLLSVWGAWDAYGAGDRWKVFRRLVGAFLFLFGCLERYWNVRARRREG